MASVFLSYARDDTAKARPIALALENAGHSVWWDLHVRGGAQFSKVIEEALKAADVVLVLWSAKSIDSAWVRDEAGAGRDSGRLVPVTLDAIEPPLGFRQFQTIDLSRWKGRRVSAELRTLLSDIDAIAEPKTERVSASAPAPAAAAPVIASASHGGAGRRRLLLTGLSVAALLAGGGLMWKLSATRSSTPTVAVAAADTSPLSLDMARNLLAKLGSLQANAADPVRLPEDIGPVAADIRFSVNGTSRGNSIRANLSLVSGREKTMLWSKDLERSAADRSALEEALASAAGRVLRCAAEEASGKYGRLREDLRRTYLNACAALTESSGDSGALIPQLRDVTLEAPKFRPAWAQLLAADEDYVGSLPFGSEEDRAARAALSKDAAAARNGDPDMTDATLAELVIHRGLTPAQGMAIVDKAKAQDPQNPRVLVARAMQLDRVGRMLEAEAEGEAAAKLDPLSPTTYVNMIFATLFAGHADRARLELASAKRLWPDSAVVREAEYELVLRSNNDFEKMSREMGYIGPGFEIYRNARLHPSDATIGPYMTFMRRSENIGRMSFALQGLGEINRPNEFYQLLAEPGDGGVLSRDASLLFRPWMASVRRDPRFMGLAKRIGLIDYWRKSGHWPDFCADAALRYDCKAEAAKLN